MRQIPFCEEKQQNAYRNISQTKRKLTESEFRIGLLYSTQIFTDSKNSLKYEHFPSGIFTSLGRKELLQCQRELCPPACLLGSVLITNIGFIIGKSFHLERKDRMKVLSANDLNVASMHTFAIA